MKGRALLLVAMIILSAVPVWGDEAPTPYSDVTDAQLVVGDVIASSMRGVMRVESITPGLNGRSTITFSYTEQGVQRTFQYGLSEDPTPITDAFGPQGDSTRVSAKPLPSAPPPPEPSPPRDIGTAGSTSDSAQPENTRDTLTGLGETLREAAARSQSLTAEVESLRGRIDTLNEAIEQLEESGESFRARTARASLAGLQAQLDSKIQEQSAVGRQLGEIRETISTTTDRLRENFESTSQAFDQEIQRARANAELDRTRIQTDQEALARNLANKRNALSASITARNAEQPDRNIPTLDQLIVLQSSTSSEDQARFNDIMTQNSDLRRLLDEFSTLQQRDAFLTERLGEIDPALNALVADLERRRQTEQEGLDELLALAGEGPSVPRLPGAPAPAAPGAPAAPIPRPTGVREITSPPIQTNNLLDIPHDAIATIHESLVKQDALEAQIEQLETRLDAAAAGAPTEQIQREIDQLKSLLNQEQAALDLIFPFTDTDDLQERVEAIPLATREMIAASEGIFQPGIFLDPETGTYFSVDADGNLNFDSAERFIVGTTEFTLSTDQLGLAFSNDGIARNARTGAVLRPGDRIELTIPRTNEKINGRVLGTADTYPAGTGDSDSLIIETRTGFFGALFSLFGEGSEISTYTYGPDGKPIGGNTQAYDEDLVENLRDGYETQAKSAEDILKAIQLRRIEASQLSPEDREFLDAHPDPTSDPLFISTRAGLLSELERIQALIGAERDFSDLEELTVEGRRVLGQDDLDLLQQLLDENGNLPPDLTTAAGLDEAAAKALLELLENRERDADLSTDRNTLILGNVLDALGIMNFLGGIQAQYGGLGRFASLFIEDDDMLGIKDEVHQGFCDSVLFGDPSCRAQAFCELTPDAFAGGNVIIGGSAEQLSAAAHIEAFVYPPVVVENVTAERGGRFSTERLYQVTYSVSLSGEDDNSYNVIFKGPIKTSRMFSSSQPLGESGSARRDRKNPFLRYSKNIYSSACIEFIKKITDFTGAKHRDLCVPIIVKQGAAPNRVRETADSSTTQRGESPDF